MHIQILHGFADRRVFDPVYFCHSLDLRIGKLRRIIKKAGKMPYINITIFIKGRRYNCSAVFLIEIREIGAASKKRHPKWGLCYNHFSSVLLSSILNILSTASERLSQTSSGFTSYFPSFPASPVITSAVCIPVLSPV